MSTKWKFTVAVSLIAIVALFTNGEKIHACSCEGPFGPSEEFEYSDAVFRGVVISKTGLRSECDSTGRRWFRDAAFEIKVNAVWKGELNETTFITTNYHGASCGYPFEIGEEYIVYANVRDGTPRVGLCSRTRSVSDAAEDVGYLGAWRKPEPGSTDPEPTPVHLGGICLSTTPDPSPNPQMPSPSLQPLETESPLPPTGGCAPLVHDARASLDTTPLLLAVGVIWLRIHTRRRRTSNNLSEPSRRNGQQPLNSKPAQAKPRVTPPCNPHQTHSRFR